MANGEFIELLSPSALKDLTTANAELLTMVANVDKVNQKMKGISTPSGSDGAIKQLTIDYQKQEETIRKLQIQIQKLVEKKATENNAIAKTMRALENETKSRQALDAQRQKALTAIDKEQAKLNASENIYNKIQAKMNLLSAEYKNLATRRELGIALTDKESKRYDFLQGKIQTYDKTLKAVDATMGKHQRNVGNYASAFNPLSNSINQLTREMPAFTYSVQTGFMALSNNIPIFTDAIGNAIAQNKLLQKEGKPTTSILSQLGSAFFSWQTLLGVGITLLTVYGKEIGEWIGSLTKTSKSIDAVKESQKQLNDINQEGRKNAVEETVNLQALLAIAKDTALSYKERMIAVKELQSTYPAYFGNLEKEQILAGNTALAEKALTDAILSRAKANAAVSKITENQAKIIDFELEKLETQKALNRATADYEIVVKRMQKIQTGKSDVDAFKVLSLADRIQSLKKDILSLDKDIAEQDKINTTLTSFAIEKQKESILLKYQEVKTIKEKNKELEKATQLQEFLSKLDFENAFSLLEEQINSTSILNGDYEILINTLASLKKTYDELYGSVKKTTGAQEDFILLSDEEVFYDTINEAERTRKEMIALQKATEDWLKVLQSDAFNKAFDNIGLNSAKMFFDFDENGMSTFDKLMKGADTLGEKMAVTFQAVGDVAQDVFNKITEMQNQRFENALENLNQEKEIALAFAGENVAGREEIERQYEQRRKEIERKKAQEAKKTAIFNAIIDTAQGVVAALAEGPKGIPLAVLIGALGAIQIGLISSTPIPEYEHGTDNHKGGLMKINDQKGSNYKEIVQTPDGKMRMFNERNKVLNAPKGTKVFTASESALMFDNGLNNMLLNNGISMPKVEVNNNGGLTDSQVKSIVNAIENKAEFSQLISNGDLKTVVKKHKQTVEIANSRIRGIGKTV
jgi:hypothetical protein